MNSHQASEQMLGYMYQIRYALYALLHEDDPQTQICIEKFDDISLDKPDGTTELVQLKHHLGSSGDLTNASVDLWRTLKLWIDLVNKEPFICKTTYFYIITTAVAPLESIACKIKSGECSCDEIYGLLYDTATKSENKSTRKSRDAFLALDSVIAKAIIERIKVIDSEHQIDDLDKLLLRLIRVSCKPDHERKVLERLEGWWFEQSIQGLMSATPIFINQNQVRFKLVDISHEYDSDNLPIDIPASLGEDCLEDDRVFCEQLRLISAQSKSIRMAIKDYYRAYEQRGHWIRDGLLYINDLDNYEERLCDEWQHLFAMMEDDLLNNPVCSEGDKSRAGRELYRSIQNSDIRIRSKCDTPFIMRGSYHMLAGRCKVGWHVDFIERLKAITSEGAFANESMG